MRIATPKTSVFMRAALGLPLSAMLALPAFARLGSFAPADGYNINVFSGSANWSDVSYYNAGAFGPNAGGGSGPTALTPDSGLWRLTGPVGGFFPSAAARTAATGTAPPYPTSVPPGTIPAYIIGNHGPGRLGDGSSLAVRNDTPAGTGPIQYEYDLDIYDTGGPSPSSVTNGTVVTSFYFMSDPVNPVQRQDKFTMSFTDSLGNVGVQWGYARDNEITWRTNTSGLWTYTGLYADPGDWDGVTMSIDLSSDTFQLDYFDVSTSTTTTLAAAGTPLGTAMLNLTTLGWQLEDAVHFGTGGKNFFDDFGFVVPEPSTLVLSLFGAAMLMRRR